MQSDESLEEIWRIKREIAAEYPTLEAYFRGMMEYQENLRRQGIKFVRFPPRPPERPAVPASAPYPTSESSVLCVAESGPPPYKA